MVFGKKIREHAADIAGRKADKSEPAPDKLLAELVHLAAEEADGGLLITSWDGAGVYANAAFRALFDLPEATADFSGILDATASRIDQQGRSREVFEGLRREAAKGATETGEVILRNNENRPMWRRLKIQPFGGTSPGHDGGHRYVLWQAEDFTREKRVQAARQSADLRRADLLDRMPAGFFSVDAQGRIVYANHVLAAWLGVERQGLRGRQFSEFVVHGSQGTDEDGGEHGEVFLKPVAGDSFPATLMQTYRTAGNGELAYTRSLVMRGMAWQETDLWGEPGSSRGRFRSLFDDAPVGIVLSDVQGLVIDCNRTFLSLLGRHRDAVAERPITTHLAENDRGAVMGALSRVAKGQSKTAQLEVELAAGSGEPVIASLFASRMEDDSGEVAGLVLHFIDATEQKALELQVSQSQKMQAVGQLAGGVAHDFNNLLTAMIGFTDLLLERHGPGDPSFNDLQQIKQNANRATNLVRQLLAFSRKQNLAPETLNPREALNDLVNLLRRLLGEKVKLSMEHDRETGLIKADRGQFDQVIINLAVNARDAMPDGGPLIIKTSNVDLEEAIQHGAEKIPAGPYVMIEVKDAGSGIAKEDLERIFEPFFSTKEVGAGTGLGLSTVYGIIHQSDGYVSVDSAVGRGTTFKLYLPRITGDAAAAPASAPQKQAKGEGKKGEPELPLFEADLTGAGTILLVEDEDAVRMFGARALRNKGYKVLEARNGEAALDVIDGLDRQIDLVVSDVVMPGMDGYSLVQEVRRQLPGVRVILMSGYAEDAFQEEIDRDETIHFLPKPFTLKTLAGTVKEVLSGDI